MQNDWDVIVIGGGLAGVTAAMSAADAGSRVLILEKTAEPGGSARLSGGSFAFAGTDLQRKHGIDDSPELLREDLLAVGEGKNDPALVDLYVAEQLAAYEWLREIGVPFERVSLSSNQSRPRTHGTNAPQMFEAVLATGTKHPNITFRMESGADRLLRSEDRVTGVQTGGTSGGAGRESTAASGVVLASGGFTRSPRLLQAFAPRFRDAPPLGGTGNTGDGILLGMALGADLVDMGYVKGTFGTSLARDSAPPILLIAMYRGAVVVNLHGRRFVDESLSYKVIGDACLEQPDALGCQVFDSRVMEQTRPDLTVNDFAGALERGHVHAADTLEELAAKVGIDPSGLVETISTYNADVRAGRDTRFGRDSLGNGVGEPPEVAVPPFYAYPCTTGLPSTYGGLRVDAALRVIDVFGNPIRGLHAAGEVVGGFHGASYMSGSSLAKSVISGRVAGRSATADR